MLMRVSLVPSKRTFSCIKRVKNYLRNSLSHTNLTSLSIVSVEKRIDNRTRESEKTTYLNDYTRR